MIRNHHYFTTTNVRRKSEISGPHLQQNRSFIRWISSKLTLGVNLPETSGRIFCQIFSHWTELTAKQNGCKTEVLLHLERCPNTQNYCCRPSGFFQNDILMHYYVNIISGSVFNELSCLIVSLIMTIMNGQVRDIPNKIIHKSSTITIFDLLQ